MNQSLFTYFNNLSFRSEIFDTLIIFCAVFLGWWFVVGLIIFVLKKDHTKSDEGRETLMPRFAVSRVKELLVIVSAAIIAWVVSQIINYFYISPRPFIVLPEVTPLFFHGENDSFPSGHATFFFSLATGLYFYHKKLAYLYFAGALIIGISRIITGIHWPADILAGYIIGGIIAVAVYYIYKKAF